MGKHIISKIKEHESENRSVERENSIPLVSMRGGSNIVESKNLVSILGETRLYNKSEIFNFDSIFIKYTNQKNKEKMVFLCKRVDIMGQQHWVE